MTEEQLDEQDIQEEEPEEVQEDDEVEEEVEEEVDFEAKFKESEEKRKQLFARLKREDKKAEPKATPNDDALSQTDMLAVLRADVGDDDLPEVIKFAKGTGMSVAEALKDTAMQAVLKVKSEERASAQASDTGRSPGGRGAKSIESIRTSAESKGEFKSDGDMDRYLDDKYTVK